MARRRNGETLKQRINRTSGQRQNMNGAGVGGRLVYNRKRGVAGQSQTGSRRQRYSDVRKAFGLSGG